MKYYEPQFVVLGREMLWIDPNGNRELVIPVTEATKISSSAFGKCRDVVSIVFPEGITELRIALSRDCESLKRIVLPSTLKTIREGCFENLAFLEEVVLSEGVEEIEENAFKNCTELKSINIPSSVKVIKKTAFECCSSLEAVALPKGIEQVDIEAFKDCPRLRISLEEGMSEQKKAELSGLLPDCYSIYEVCPEGLENEEGVGKISLNGCSPFYCEGAIEIRTATLSREKFLELFEQTRPYHIIYGYSNDRRSALCRGIRPSEAVYRDGKFYGIRAIYHDEGEYNDRTLAWIEEPFDAPFILEIGKEAKTHVSCFCKLTRRAELQSE